LAAQRRTGILQHGLKHRLKFARRRADDAQHLRESLPLFPRLLKLVCLALEFFLQIDKRMAAARWYRRAGIGVLVAFHLSRLTTTCFHCFTACSAPPFHLALQFGRRANLTTALSAVVHHGKIGPLRSEVGSMLLKKSLVVIDES
jgi:hypothetical protein